MSHEQGANTQSSPQHLGGWTPWEPSDAGTDHIHVLVALNVLGHQELCMGVQYLPKKENPTTGEFKLIEVPKGPWMVSNDLLWDY